MTTLNRAKSHFLPFFLACLLFTSPVLAQQADQTGSPVQSEPQPLQVENMEGEQVIQQVSSLQDEMIGYIDWENNVVYAVGDGVPPQDAINPAQARVRAKRAAIDEGMARLLELVQEVRVDAESTTRNFVNESRVVSNRVSGIIKNAEIAELRQAEDGSYQIKLKMPLHGARSISAVLLPLKMNNIVKVGIITRVVREDVVQEQPMQTTEAKISKKVTEPEAVQTELKEPATYTGLIIDATGLNASPALYPSIITESGAVVYNLSVADPNAAVEDGLCTYRKSMVKAKSLPLIGSNPLKIKAVKTGGTNGVDLIIADVDGDSVTQADKINAFLKEARVVVIID